MADVKYKRIFKFTLFIGMLAGIPYVYAAEQHVSDYSSFKAAINNAQDGDTIVLDNSIQVTGTIGSINKNITIDGQGQYGIYSSSLAGFTVSSEKNVTFKNMGQATVNLNTGEITYVQHSGLQGFKRSYGGALRNNGIVTTDNVIFYGNNGANGHGSAMYNSSGNTVMSVKGKFLNNTNGGGALANYGVIEYIEADFVGNSGGTHGGAILNNNGGRILKIRNSNFIANSSTRSGGAIRNLEGNGNEVTIYDSLFRFNSSIQGGAIKNGKPSSNLVVINNSTFDRNYSLRDPNSQGSLPGGGAISSEGGTVYITDSQFMNNAAEKDGGAILSEGLLYINAKETNVEFKNNKSGTTIVDAGVNATVTGGVYNDLYLLHDASINANTGKSITFNGSVVNGKDTVTLSLNSDAEVKGGNYIFNNDVTGGILDIHNGANIKLGSCEQKDSTTSYGVLNNIALQNDTIAGGKIDFQNNHIDNHVLTTLALNSDINIKIDADLGNGISDYFSASSYTGSGKLNIVGINVLTDNMIGASTKVSNSVLKDAIKLSIDSVDSSSFSYALLYDNTPDDGGYLKFSTGSTGNTNLVTVNRANDSQRVYSLGADENIAADIAEIGDSSTSIGAMGGSSGAVFTINGNSNYSIIGENYGGITINSGKTLNVNKVGSLDENGDVKAAWKGFKDTLFTVNNGGTLNFTGENVIAENTSTDKNHLIYNNGGTITTTEGKLNILNNNYNASLINNTDGTIDKFATLIKGNLVKVSLEKFYGGIIYNNADAGKVAKINELSGEISDNEINNTKTHEYGGIIYNYAKGDAEIDTVSAIIKSNQIKTNSGMYGAIIRNEAENGKVTIGKVSGDIKDNTITFNNDGYGVLISNKGNKKSAEIGSISGNIENNIINMNSNKTLYGGISNEGNAGGTATIGSITSDILNNKFSGANNALQGGIIYNYAKSAGTTIETISGNISKNQFNFKSAEGAIIENKAENGYIATIESISGNIEENIVVATNAINGGIIYNKSQINSISGKIANNYAESKNGAIKGGVLFNDTDGNILVTSDIENNYTKAKTLNTSMGGIIYNSGNMTLSDSSMKNNATNMGNIISNIGTLNILADNKNVIFTANRTNATVSRDETSGDVSVTGGDAIDIQNRTGAILNLYAKTGKSITFDGEIRDDDTATAYVGGTYAEKKYDGSVIFNNKVTLATLNIQNNGNIILGVKDAQYGLLNLTNLKNDTENGLINTLNNHIESHQVGKVALNSALNINIDMNISDNLATTADTFELGANSVGTFNITDLNMYGEGVANFRAAEQSQEITQKVLDNANNNTRLTLSNDVKAAYESAIADELIEGSDGITETTVKYNKKYGDYEFKRQRTTSISVVGSSLGLADAIKWAITVTDSDKEYKNDTLHLINIASGANRIFDFDGTTNTYTATQDTGTTAVGKLTILGTQNGTDYSTIDANDHSLFDITTAGATVEIQNTKIKNAKYVANVASGDVLTLRNVIIDDTNDKSITGTGTTIISGGKTTLSAEAGQNVLTINSDGELENNAKFTLADKISNTGKLTSIADNIITQNGIENEGVINFIGGENSNNISGTNGTVNFYNSSINSGKIEQKIITNSDNLTSDAGNLKASAGIQNTGNLNLTGGMTQSIISGENGTVHIIGPVTIGKAINDNVLSLDSSSTKLGITDISTTQKLVANGGDLNLQYLPNTENYNLGNFEILGDMGLAIDVDLTGNSAIKKADSISATTVSGSKKIYINNLKITVPNPGDEAPTYSKVTDNNLKDSVDLGDNAKTHVNYIPQNGFMITYEKDTEGENTGGFLHLTYADLVTAARATTRSKIYVMGSADENIVSQLAEQGGTGITDNNHLFGGISLSVDGAGSQSVVGGGTTGGIQLAGTQTLSLNNIKVYKGFSTGITNYGTLNITDVKFSENTTDIENNTTLNLYGTDEFKEIKGNSGTINIASYVDADDQTINAEVTFATDGNIIQKDIVIAENNILKNNANLQSKNKISNTGTITSKANNIITTNGIENEGILNLTGGANSNTVTGTNGIVYLTNNGSNSASITQKNIINSGTYANSGIINGVFDNSNATLENNKQISLLTMDGGTLNNTENGIISATNTIKGNITNTGEINNNGSIISEAGNTYTNQGVIKNSGNISISGNKELGKITDKDNLTTGRINIGSSETDIITVNKEIAKQTVSLDAGTLKLNTTGSLTDTIAFIGNNGTLDTQNNQTDSLSLGNVTLNNDIMWAINADLANSMADNLSGNANPSGSGKFLINAINLLSDSNYKYIETKVADNNLKGVVGLALDQFIVNNLAGNGSYTVTYEAKTDGGYLTFDNSDINNLVLAARKEGSVVYSMSQNESIGTDLAIIPDNTTNAIGNQKAENYTINGNGHNIDGANKGGIIVSNGQSLTINNVDEIKNFTGNVITNSGTLNINAKTNDSIFASTAGIKNSGNMELNTEAGKQITILGSITDDNIAKGVATIKGDGTVNIENSIIQDKLLIESGTVNVAASNLKIDEFVQNNSVLNLDEGILNSIINGNSGTTNITGEVSNNKSITQKEIKIEENAKLTTNSGKITALSGIDNKGILEWIGSGENNNLITSSNNAGIIEVKDAVHNKQSITQNKIIITGDNAELVSSANNLSTAEGIENNSLLTLTDGQNTNKISGTGKLAIMTDNQVENKAEIKQKQIAVDEGTLISDVANLTATENIEVSGLLRLTGTGDNKNQIKGNGTTEIAGTLTTSNTISSNLAISGTLKTSADKLDIATKSLKGVGGTLDLSDNNKYAEVLTVQKLDLDESNLNLKIDVDLANKQSDRLNVTSISGSNKLVIKGLNLISDAQENLPILTTVLSVNDTSEAEKLSQNVELQGAPLTIQGKTPKYSYLVSYIVKDLTGNLQFDYANLATAIIFDADQKVYTMSNEESLSEEKTMQGKNLSIYGNENDITGDGTNNGIKIGDTQTISINDVNNMHEFDQAIINDGGTVNLKNVNFANNTVDVNNNNTLNLEGNNVLQDGIIGDNGETNIISGKTTLSGETTQKTITVAEATLNNQGIISATINNAGTINNENKLQMNGSSVNTGTISGNGTLVVNGTLENTEDTASIVQDKVQIKDNGELTSDNDKISAHIVNDGIFNMSGAENNNIVEGTGIVNINSSMKLNKQIGGTNTVNVNEGVLTFADNAALGSNVKLNANEGSSIDIENNQMSVDQVVFKEGSTLKLKVNSLSDFGSIIANTINVEQGANLFAVLGQGLIEVGQKEKIQLLTANNSDFNNFIDSFENNMYRFEKDGKNGTYVILQAKTAEDVLKEANADRDIIDAGHAWVDGSRFPDANSQEIADKLAELAQNDGKGFVKALKGIVPSAAPIVKTLAIEHVSYVSDMLQNHIYNRNEEQQKAGLSSGDELLKLDASVWVKTYAGRSTIEAQGNAGGFDINRRGAVFGVDKKVNSALLAGVGYATDTTKAKSSNHKDKVQTHSVFAYAQYKPNNWYIEGEAGYSHASYDETKQSVSTVNAKYDTSDIFMETTGGYDIKYHNILMTPEMSLRYNYIERDGYKDSAGQKVAGDKMHVLTPVVGINVSTEFAVKENKLFRKATIKPEAYVGVGYDIISDRDNAFVKLNNGETYILHGNQLDRFFVETKAGAKTSFTDDVDLGLWYLGNYRSDYQSHAGMVELKVRF